MSQASVKRGNGLRARDVAIGVSLAAHVVLFTILGLTVPTFAPREAPPSPFTHIWLMPRQRLDTPEPIRSTPSRPRAAPLAASPKVAAAKPADRPLPPRLARPAPGIAAVPGAPAASRPAGASPRGGEPTQETWGGVTEALRTSVGCDAEGDDNVVHLTPAERDKCHQKLGAEARKAPAFSGIDPAKRGRFDAQADADERRRAGREAPLQQLVVPCGDASASHAEGTNLGGGCLPDASVMHFPQH